MVHGASVMVTRAATHDRGFDHCKFHSRLTKWRTVVAASKGQPICEPDRLADYWWHIKSGAVRQARLQSNGLRCIHEFFLPNEWFVCDNAGEDTVVDAVCDGTVLGRYKRADLEGLAEEGSSIAQTLREARLRRIARAEEHIFNLWHQRSVDKVRVFLDQMSARMPARADGFVSLPMSSYDIADYLGLSVETVSRALGDLQARRIVEFDGVRRLRILRMLATLPPPANWGKGSPRGTVSFGSMIDASTISSSRADR